MMAPRLFPPISLTWFISVGSELWFHLPPATPPFVLLSAIPLRAKGAERRVPTLFSNPYVRNIALASLGLAVLSWAHAELDRKRLLEPMPVPEQYKDIARAFLPPFLPEDVEPDLTLDVTLVDDEPRIEAKTRLSSHDDVDDDDDDGALEGEVQKLPHKLRRHLQCVYEARPKPQSMRSTLQQWRTKRRSHKGQTERAKRMEIYDELVALQALKKQAMKRKNQKRKRNQEQSDDASMTGDELGYALVTGASRGIGRALAIELARWEIPLILVARDEDKLVNLAADIERCYGVKCCVLTADLSKPDAAEKIYEATTAAGLPVDILISNAGLSSSGEFVDMDEGTLRNIMQVNAVSVASLCHLYGNEMKKRRRGRMLIVSSVVGISYAGPTVAAYAATKAFEKVLGLSMAKELEVYGVGVTCLLPGAVGDSSFRKSSGSGNALCWKVPFYVRSCETVADQGIRAMLGGDLEVIPGWQNRAFAKIMLPILPQRAITVITEAAWNPISHWRPKLRRNTRSRATTDIDEQEEPVEPAPRMAWPGHTQQLPPKILKLTPSPAEPEEADDQASTDSSNDPSLIMPQLPPSKTENSTIGEPIKAEEQSISPEPTSVEESTSATTDDPVTIDSEEAPMKEQTSVESDASDDGAKADLVRMLKDEITRKVEAGEYDDDDDLLQMLKDQIVRNAALKDNFHDGTALTATEKAEIMRKLVEQEKTQDNS
jgi:short-subunit dehydrogenase